MNSGRDFRDFIDDYSEGNFSGFFQQIVADIYTYRTNEDLIKIRFDIISKSDMKEILPNELYQRFLFADRDLNSFKKDIKILEELACHTDPRYIAFTDISTSGPVSCQIQDSESEKYIKSSITYQLPALPHLALNLLGFFSHFICTELDTMHCVHLYNACPDDNDLEISMEDYIEIKNILDDEVDIKLMKSIISLQSDTNDKYNDVFNSLQKILDYPRKESFIQKIEIINRCNILHSDLVKQVLNNKISDTAKQYLLLKTGREYISKNQQAEFSFLIKSLNYMARKDLFESCYKNLPDERKLECTLDNMEWFILKTADFQLQDKRISFSNPLLQEIPSNRRLLNPLKILAEFLSLDFEPYCITDPKIAFTIESTDKLKQYNIHFTEHFIKKAMYKENFWGFFNRCEIDKNIGKTNILLWDKNLLQEIQNEMEAACNTPRGNK